MLVTKKILSFFIVTLLVAVIQAQPVLLCDTLHTGVVDLSPYTDVWIDPSGASTVETLHNKPFIRLDDFAKPIGFLKNNQFCTWVRIRTKGMFATPKERYWFFGKKHHLVEVYTSLGTLQGSTGSCELSAFLIPAVNADSAVWYVKIQSFPYQFSDITPALYTQEGWLAENAAMLQAESFPFTVLIGMGAVMLFMFVFSLVQYSIHKDVAYVFYSFFLFAISLNLYRVNLEPLIPLNTLNAFLVEHGNKWSSYLGYFFYFWFVIYFLDLPRYAPPLNRVLRWAAYVSMSILGLHLLFYYGLQRYDWASYLYYGSRYLFLAFSWYCMWQLFVHKPPFYGYILVGSLMVSLGAAWWFYCGMMDAMGHFVQRYPNVLFYLTVLAEAILFVTGLAHKFRVTELEKRQAQLKLIADRERLSRDLHDDIGSTLNSLALMSSAAQRIESKKEILEQINDVSREAVERMGDIVWAISPRGNDKIAGLLTKMREFSHRLFGHSDLRVRFDIQDAIQGLDIGEDARWNLYLIFKEAMNNIQKHAQASLVQVTISVENQHLILTIQDNGCGFEPQKQYLGNGLKTMQERVQQLSGQITFQSQQDTGTVLKLTIPATQIH